VKTEQNEFLDVLLLLCPVAFLTEYARSGLLLGLAAAVLVPLCHLLTTCLPVRRRTGCRIAFAVTVVLVTVYMFVLEKYYPAAYYRMEGGLACVTAAVYYVIWRPNGNSPRRDPVTALIEGFSYLMLVTAFGAFRELLAYGSLFGVPISKSGLPFFARPEAAFFLLAVMMAAAKALSQKLKGKRL